MLGIRIRIWIQIRRILMFFATRIRIRIRLLIRLLILPSSSKNSKKNLDFYCFVTSLWLFIFEEWCKYTSVTDPDPYVFVPPGSASGSVPKCHGSPTLNKKHPLVRILSNIFTSKCDKYKMGDIRKRVADTLLPAKKYTNKKKFKNVTEIASKDKWDGCS